MNKREFEQRLSDLVRSAGTTKDNTGCVACVGCEGCRDATFCRDSKRLSRCNYCVTCEDCSECSHCHKSKQLTACVHCVDCERCTGSAYVVRSIGLSGCTYCFGCVGLVKKDFHILNEPYDRKTYFETVAKLKRELGYPG